MADDRLQRELEFHDDRFTDDSARADAKKYYSVTRASSAAVDAVLGDLRPGARILELGCGVTNHAEVLGRSGHHVTAIDLSPVAVAEMRARMERVGLSEQVTVAVMNAEDLQLPEESFEAVVGTGILHHLDLATTLPGLARVLSPEGFGVFVEPLGRNPVINAYRRLTPRMRTPDEHPLVEADFELAGRWFGRVQIDYFHALTLAAVPLRRTRVFDAALPLLERGDRWMFSTVRWARALAWSAVLVLKAPRPGHEKG